MSAIGFVRKALAMGVDLETALKMGEAFEEAHPVYVPPVGIVVDPTTERRRAYDRERQAEKRAAEKAAKATSSVHPPTSAESVESAGRPLDTGPTKDAPTPVHTRVEDNPSRLDTTGLVVVGGVEAREPDQPGDDWPKGDAKRHAELIVETVASPRLDPHKSTTLVTTTGRIAAWKRAGASWEHDVLPVIQAGCQGRRDRINGWQYFDAAIARSIADNRRALDIPEAQARAPPRRQTLAEQVGDESRRATELALSRLKAQANG